MSFTLPENPNLEAIALAKRLGTYGKHDRSPQYEEERYSSEKLLRNVNLIFAKLREHEDRELRSQIIVALVTAALARMPEIILWAQQFLK